ncbi:hypothetical protein [uncultured Winogradskyella sp.]|uniref:hypothetical protein n=1 Tax=uncultured Winogradskyella sp. TaxID=395353 RepID=UPI0026035B2D|nr:hypothetical protein [uncultured Winogradskyella sp.]
MTNSLNKPPIWFWIVSVLALVWNSLGVHGYVSQAYKTKAFTDAYTTEQIEVMTNLPTWYTALFAIAVFAGAIGCLLLLFRKKIAKLLLTLSFLAATIQMVYFLFIADLNGVDFSANKIMAYIIIVFAAFLVWFAKNAITKNWIK